MKPCLHSLFEDAKALTVRNYDSRASSCGRHDSRRHPCCKAPKSFPKFSEEAMPRMCGACPTEKIFSLACDVQRVLMKYCLKTFLVFEPRNQNAINLLTASKEMLTMRSPRAKPQVSDFDGNS